MTCWRPARATSCSRSSARLPLKIICDMMGIGDEHYAMVLRNTNIILSGADPEFISEDMDEAPHPDPHRGRGPGRAGHRPGRAAPGAARPTTWSRRWSPPTSTASSSPPAELASFFILLVVAGNETTRNAISHALVLLTEHPDQRALLLADLEGRIGPARRGDRPLRLAGHLDAAHADPGHRAERARLRRGRQGPADVPVAPTGTSGLRRRRTGSTSPARPTRTSASARRARTSASARTWPAGRSRPCCANC